MTFIFFIVGVVFGALGLIGKDGVQVINFVFSNENLSLAKPHILGNAQAGEYLNVCLNGIKFFIILILFVKVMEILLLKYWEMNYKELQEH